MRFERLATALLSVVSAGLPVLAATPSSAATPSYGTTMTLSVTPSAGVTFQTPIVLEGQVVPDSSTPGLAAPADAQVALRRQWRGQTTWYLVATTTTNKKGAYKFDVTATRNATYKVTFRGGTTTDPTTGDSITYSASQATQSIWVRRTLNDFIANPAPDRYYLKGNVDPGWGDEAVHLQRKVCKSCAWENYKRHTTTSEGEFRFRLDFPQRVEPTWYYRVKVPSTKEYTRSFSNAYSVTLGYTVTLV